ncbi:type I restriction enzyme, R subunit [Staphylococcus capitis]
MANAIKTGHKAIERYKEDKVVFIIDECHRTQFGDMHRVIKQHFKNAQYFGFTGTPRFEENASQDGRATADIFGKCLHTYLIKDAIRDGNVLGFSVEYLNTFDTLKDNIDEEYVSKIDENEIWMADDRLKKVAKHLVANHHKKTRKQMYTSIFTVHSIPMAIRYYKIFKEMKEAGLHNLNVSTIFTYNPNEDMHKNREVYQQNENPKHSREELETVIKDYNKMFDKNYSTDTFDGFFNDVSQRVKRGMPGERLDILIVVDMFLTGFDSKKLNTLYVDRNLQYHTLIQAYSRTNRVEDETKPYGNIVCYRNLKENTDKAIELFSQTDDVDTVLSASFDEYLVEFKKQLIELYKVADTPEAVDRLEREDDIKEFVLTFRSLSRLMQMLKTFDEFSFDKDKLGIAQQTFQDYRGKYLNLYDAVRQKNKREINKVSVLDDIDFEVEILRNDLINVQYILDLLNQIDLTNKEEPDKACKQIRKLLEQADDDKLRLKADLIREFLDSVIPHLEEEIAIDDAYYEFEEEVKEGELQDFAKDQTYPIDLLKQLVSEYEYSGQLDNNLVEEGVSGGLLVRTKKIDNVKSFVQETVEKYGAVD